MAKILFLGTRSGTEPLPGMHHASVAIESNGFYYWFDAGECCSQTAAEMGVDLLKMKSVFISHSHIDHMGGLLNLLWSVTKMISRGYGMPPEGRVSLFTPDMQSWEGLEVYHKSICGNNGWRFEMLANRTVDGLVYSDENITVRAIHNLHIPSPAEGEYLSYSYIIEVAGKKIVYSGDVKELTELCECIGEHCDVLICETGHHKVDDVLKLAQENSVRRLIFTHHGREIINGREDAERRAAGSPCDAVLAYDKMVVEL